jgi:hypothetical protein
MHDSLKTSTFTSQPVPNQNILIANQRLQHSNNSGVWILLHCLCQEYLHADQAALRGLLNGGLIWLTITDININRKSKCRTLLIRFSYRTRIKVSESNHISCYSDSTETEENTMQLLYWSISINTEARLRCKQCEDVDQKCFAIGSTVS